MQNKILESIKRLECLLFVLQFYDSANANLLKHANTTFQLEFISVMETNQPTHLKWTDFIMSPKVSNAKRTLVDCYKK